MTRVALALALLGLLAGVPAVADAARPANEASGATRTTRATPVTPVELDGVQAKRRVRDRVLRTATPRAWKSAARNEVFTDPDGNQITISSDLVGIDLSQFASILAGTIHGAEIRDLRVLIVAPEQIVALCGDGARACYMADDGQRSFAGQMVLPAADPDLTHIVVHEYGHHIDNQLVNIGHLGGCNYDADGSRNWFFERDLQDDLIGSGINCRFDSEWESLLPELYAEDFVSLNGFSGWVLPSVPPPTRLILDAMRSDLEFPFSPRRLRWNTRVGADRCRTRRLSLPDWTFFGARLRGPRGTDFDLGLFPARGRKLLAKSSRRGSREYLEATLAPGRYELVVCAYKGRGLARNTLEFY